MRKTITTMRLNTIVIISLLLITIGCENAQDKLIDDELVKQVFTEEEIHSLDKIINFFDSLTYNKTYINEIDNRYHSFFDSLDITLDDCNYTDICINERIRDNFFKPLKLNGIFYEIWVWENPILVRTNDTLINNPDFYFSIDLNNQGRYFQLLELMSEHDKYFDGIYKSCSGVGGLAPTVVGGFIENNENITYDKARIRLWAAIFYLTLEAPVEVRLEKYLNNQ